MIDARRIRTAVPESRQRALRPRGLSRGAAARRDGGAARLRLGVVGRAPLHRLHDVSRRHAVPELHGGEDDARAARLDGGGAAVARPGARRRADRDARQPLGRAHHPRARTRSRARRVRRLPHRSGRGAQPLRRVRAARARRARARLHRGRRGDAPAAPRHPAAAVQELPRPHLRRGGVARVDADHGAARHRPAGGAAEAVGRGEEGLRRLPPGVPRGERRRRGAAAFLRRVHGRRRGRRSRPRRWRTATSAATTTR